MSATLAGAVILPGPVSGKQSALPLATAVSHTLQTTTTWRRCIGHTCTQLVRGFGGPANWNTSFGRREEKTFFFRKISPNKIKSPTPCTVLANDLHRRLYLPHTGTSRNRRPHQPSRRAASAHPPSRRHTHFRPPMAAPVLPAVLSARADALRARRDALVSDKARALLARRDALAAAQREALAKGRDALVAHKDALLARHEEYVLRAAAARRRLAAAAGRYYRPQFSDEQLSALTAYKNHGADYSITYKYVMAPIYDRLVKLLPAGLAPNAVTLIGFVLIILSHLTLMWFSPRLEEPAPGWVYIFVGVSLATYMVLDNLDGRQARRTGSSSPLGHLFDHGCDAFNVTISGLSFIAMLQLGPGLGSYAMLFFVGHLICFAASMEELFTGAMILREINGPNEGLIIMSSMHIMTGVLGPSIWRQSLSVLGVSLPRSAWVGILMSAPASFTVVGNVGAVVLHARRRGLPTSTALRDVALASCGFVLFGASLFGWAVLAPVQFADALLPILWLSCINFFYMISRMIISHLTGTPYPALLRATLPQIVCALNSTGGVVLLGAPFVPQAPLLAITFAWTAAFNAWRIYCMILQICDYLNIRCLHLGPLRPPTADGSPDWAEDGFHGNHHLGHSEPAPAVFCAALSLEMPAALAGTRNRTAAAVNAPMISATS